MHACGAKTRSGGTCRNAPVGGSNRCRMHGGATPRGDRLPQTTHGRYSKDLPTRLAARYAAGMEDLDLLSLRSEVALLDARLGELLAQLDTGEAGAVWAALRDAKREFDGAATSPEKAAALGAIFALIERGAAEWMRWRDVTDLVERRRRVVTSEHKRAADLDQMIEVRRLITLFGTIEATIRDHVSDPDVRAAIATDLRSRSLGLVPGLA